MDLTTAVSDDSSWTSSLPSVAVSRPKPKQSKKNDDPKTMFPWMLHQLLDEASQKGLDRIVSWHPNGESFCVHKRDAFMDDVLPIYFRQTKYKSFVRQLNLWGFRCINSGPDKGAYVHDRFVLDDPDLCLTMERVKIKGSRKAKSKTAKSATTSTTFESPRSRPSKPDRRRRVSEIPTVAAIIHDNDCSFEEGIERISIPKNRLFHPRKSVTLAESLFDNDPFFTQMSADVENSDVKRAKSSNHRWMDSLLADNIAPLKPPVQKEDPWVTMVNSVTIVNDRDATRL